MQNSCGETSKKKRNPNFTTIERDLLVRLVEVRLDIIEHKKTDSHTVRLKNQAWAEVASAFNSHSVNVHRSSEVLKTCWDNLKKIVKRVILKDKLKDRAIVSPPPRTIRDDPIFEKVKRILLTKGLKISLDGDENDERSVEGNEDLSNQQIEDKNCQNFEEIIVEHTGFESDAGDELEDVIFHVDWSPISTKRQKLTHSTLNVKDEEDKHLEAKNVVEDFKEFQSKGVCPFVREVSVSPSPSFQPEEVLFQESPESSARSSPTVGSHSKLYKDYKTKPSRHLFTRRKRPRISQTNDSDVRDQEVNCLNEIAIEKEKTILKIYHEKLKQEKIKTKILLEEFKTLRRKNC